MDLMFNEDKISLWLVTLPDRSHYIMACLSVDTPHRVKIENEDTHELYDAWDVPDLAFILPINNSNLPHYLRNHCWDDEPMAMIVTFFPADTSSVVCKMSQSFDRCWRYNHAKSLLACSRCIGSSCKKLKAYKDTLKPAEPVSVLNTSQSENEQL